MKLRYCFVALLLLASCDALNPGHVESARQALATFCRLHKAEIFNVLLTPKQVEAGNTVCGAIGMTLGAEND
ncbi:hypothetical protein AB4Y45_25575 [Paraburkholderia sp. EG287A]|uniref:hypothetical protein n=1 Tax=unclassified Paraburkholderia TaxID=2615204 RepID=UPI0034D271B0